mmetsp:Transcript_18708/g.24437  ORF Transcript_18708/g.24437 Transcript_18708/m.24437 type:complete len:275 (+) Transcript_18708:704-1528(+)
MAEEVEQRVGTEPETSASNSSTLCEPLGSLKLFGDSSDEDESDYVTEKIGTGEHSLEITLHVPEDGKVSRTLFVNGVWSGSKVLAQYVWENRNQFSGAKVCEFGAGAGLPGIVAGKVGASVLLLSDYPSDHILDVLKENITLNLSHDTTGVARNHFVCGHLWGEDPSPLLKPLESFTNTNKASGYDFVLASECLWCHDLHKKLLASIHSCLRIGGIAYITFSHHIPGLEEEDLSFFTKAKEAGFTSEMVKESNGKSMWSEKEVTIYLYKILKVN